MRIMDNFAMWMMGNAGGISNRIAQEIWNIAWPILTVLAGLGVLLAIWIGVRLATAQDESKRKEAKAQLIWAIIAIIIIIAVIGIFGVIVAALPSAPPPMPT